MKCNSSVDCWTQIGWMTANDPSRQKEAVNHGDVEFPGQKQPLGYATWASLTSTSSSKWSTHSFNDCPERLDDFVALRVLSQLIASGAILPTFHLDTSCDDRPRCAGGDVIVPKLPVRTSAQVVARFRRWFRVHLFASGLASISRNHSLPETHEIRHTFQPKRRWRRASDCRFLARTPSRRASGGGARNRATWTIFVDPHETLCVAGFCTTPS